MQEPRKGHWTTAGDVLRVWKRRAGLESDRILVLNQVWEREAGHLSRHWTLCGVRRGVVYVKVKSPAAMQELQLRGRELVRNLNKYFKKEWIKEIRAARG
jgi:hypothetical protein